MLQMARRTEREARAVQLALARRSYDDIAKELGFANRSGAWKSVHRALKREVVEGARDLRDVEMARLDALQAAYWSRAVDGDVKAATIVLRVIERRSRLLGLDRVEQAGAPNSLVIGGGLVG